MTRLLAIGAYAADFVWRAGGVLALTAHNGGTASVLSLSYGERGESGELWKEPDQTVENVKRIRHERPSGRPRAWAPTLPRPRRLPARGRGRGAGPADRRDPEAAPDVIVTHTDRDPFNPDHPVAFAAVERARALAAGAGVESAFPTISPAPAAAVRAAPARAVQLHADHVRGHHPGDRQASERRWRR